MKIALVLAVAPGYSETFFNSKIKGLQESGNEVILYTGPDQETYTFCLHKKSPKVNKFFLFQVLNMCLVGFRLIPHIKAVYRFFKLEKNEGVALKRILEKIYLNSQLLRFHGDWVHYGFATLAIDRELVAKAIGAKMAVSFRGFDINVYPLKHPDCYQLLWKQVDKVQSVSAYLLEKAGMLGLQKTVPFQIITPAVDLNSLPKKVTHRTSNTLKIVTIARYNWIKGINYLIKLAVCLKKSDVNFEWHLIGSGTNSEKEQYLFHIYQSGLEHHVILRGKCSHKETLNILATADLYVQTSLNEGFCNAVLEAQALGIPCVAFRVGGLPENIDDKETGWLIAPYDVEAMAKIMIHILGFTPNEKDRLSEQSITRVQNHFSLEQQKLAFQEFYMF